MECLFSMNPLPGGLASIWSGLSKKAYAYPVRAVPATRRVLVRYKLIMFIEHQGRDVDLRHSTFMFQIKRSSNPKGEQYQ